MLGRTLDDNVPAKASFVDGVLALDNGIESWAPSWADKSPENSAPTRKPAFPDPKSQTFYEELSGRCHNASQWSSSRRVVAQAINTQAFEATISVCIISSMVLVVLETDAKSKTGHIPLWLRSTINTLVVCYALELSLRLYVYRSEFFKNYWNMFDVVIIVADVTILLFSSFIGEMPSMSLFRMLRILRTVRILRSVRTLIYFRELYMMLHGFSSAMRAIGWSTMLLVVMLTMWGIIAVEIIHPLSIEVAETGAYEGCERCSRAFASVLDSNLTFIQHILAGDSWGMVSIPIIEAHPWSAAFFLGVFITVDFGLLNLILSVIVDRASQARAEDTRYLLAQRSHEFEHAKKELHRFCLELDQNRDGRLSREEILSGFVTDPDFANAMSLLEINKEDTNTLFSILDEDGSGDVDFAEFVEQIHKMRTQDSHIMLVFIRRHLQEVREKLNSRLEQIETHAQKRSEAQEETVTRMLDLISSLSASVPSALPRDGDTEPGKISEKISEKTCQISFGAVRPAALNGHADLTELQACVAQLRQELQDDLTIALRRTDTTLNNWLDKMSIAKPSEHQAQTGSLCKPGCERQPLPQSVENGHGSRLNIGLEPTDEAAKTAAMRLSPPCSLEDPGGKALTKDSASLVYAAQEQGAARRLKDSQQNQIHNPRASFISFST